MKSIFHLAPQSTRLLHRERSGAALIIVLSFVFLLTILIVAFLSRVMSDRQLSSSSFNQTRTDELARSALDIIVSDLKQEIINGSTASTSGNVTIYTPKQNTSLLVTRNGTPPIVGGVNPIPSLLRTSTTTSIPLPGIDHPASGAPTTTASSNGRKITPARWNKHYLIPRTTGASDNDTTPITSFTAPSWVYVAQEGPTVLATTPTATAAKKIVGRYAYAIYDEGSLLDINVAGYPSNTTATQSGPKGSVAFADLTALGLKQSDIDNIVGWRNYASAKPSGTLNAFGFNATSATSYFNFVKSSTNGFLTISNQTYNGQTDQQYISRQQLLDFRKTAGFTANALQYLGTFNRAVTAPSWWPTANASDLGGNNGSGNAFAYKDNADKADTQNPNLANLRAKAGTITHYRDDGTTIDYTLATGDPFLRYRFSLGKLAWITHDGNPPTGITAAKIQACFGLKWNGAASRWDYVGPTGGTPIVNIAPLSDVAKDNREPNFFELLKAGMLNGSLGKDPGLGNDDSRSASPSGGALTTNPGGVAGAGYEVKSAKADSQIIQIGANIIDQSDADSYPTAIYLPNVDERSGYPEDILANTLSGIENLPYLMLIYNVTFASKRVSGSMLVDGWLQPQFWNPHQAKVSNPGLTPSSFRIRAYGTVYTFWAGWEYAPPAYPYATSQSPKVDYYADLQKAYIYFSDNKVGMTSSIFYANPRLLQKDEATGTTTDNLWDEPTAPDARNKFAGFHAGRTANYTSPPPPPAGYFCKAYTVYERPVSYSLEYQDTSGAWHPYNFTQRISSHYYNDWSSGFNDPYKSGSTTHFEEPSVFYVRSDPRSDRFSMQVAVNTLQENMTYNPYEGYRGGADFCYPIQSGFYFFANGAPNNRAMYIGDWLMNLKTNPPTAPNAIDLANTAYYSDPDGIIRPGDGYLRNPSTGHGDQLYHDIDIGPYHDSLQIRRPVILDRPFRSVGELGYAYRDLPYKSLDFWSKSSADGALLDLFSVTEEPPLVAGQISLNSAAPLTLQAILIGASKSDYLANYITKTDSGTLASEIAKVIQTTPLGNRADLATALGSAIQTGFSTPDKANKSCAEAPVRALASVTNIRTWNLLIDVISQSGKFVPNPTNLDQFVVEGEKRYWLHIALDRFTGKIVDLQLEPVYE